MRDHYDDSSESGPIAVFRRLLNINDLQYLEDECGIGSEPVHKSEAFRQLVARVARQAEHGYFYEMGDEAAKDTLIKSKLANDLVLWINNETNRAIREKCGAYAIYQTASKALSDATGDTEEFLGDLSISTQAELKTARRKIEDQSNEHDGQAEAIVEVVRSTMRPV